MIISNLSDTIFQRHLLLIIRNDIDKEDKDFSFHFILPPKKLIKKIKIMIEINGTNVLIVIYRIFQLEWNTNKIY